MTRTSPAQLSLFDAVVAPDIDASAATAAARPVLRVSKRARRMSLQVMIDGQAELVVPVGTPAHVVERFISAQQGWLHQARREQRARHGDVSRERPASLALAAVDECWRIERRVQPGKPLRVTLRPGASARDFELRLAGDASISDTQLRDAVRGRLMARARRMYDSLLPDIAARMKSRYRRLQVRDQKTCWGSFSASGTLSMNYAALFLAPALVHYLCVHELAHYHHMDHSDAFWDTVARYVERPRALDRQLGGKQAVLPGWLW